MDRSTFKTLQTCSLRLHPGWMKSLWWLPIFKNKVCTIGGEGFFEIDRLRSCIEQFNKFRYEPRLKFFNARRFPYSRLLGDRGRILQVVPILLFHGLLVPRIESSLEEIDPAGLPLNFPARCFLNRARLEQHHLGGKDIVLI